MDLSDTREISADRATVWAALLSADVLRDCVPGCQEMTGTPEDGFEAVVVQKVGPVKATFKGKVTLSDIVAGEGLTLTGQGQGGAAGFAKGGAKVRLEDGEAGGTRLIYDVEAKVGGKLAQLGNRVIHGFAKKMADQFFDRFQDAVEEPEAEETGPEGAETAAEADAESDGSAKKKGWFKRLVAR
jgi:hypothetical protein